MSRLIDILIFWLKVVAVVFVFTTVIAFILLVFAGGIGKVSFLDLTIYSAMSGLANGLVLGSLIAMIMGWKTWRVVKSNQKKIARRRERSNHD